MGLRRSLAVVVALAVSVALATGCRSGGSSSGPVVTVPEAAPTSVPADPYAVPAVIDEAYVNRVLAALDAAVGDVVRLVVKTRTFPPEAYDRLKAIYGDADLLQREIDGFQDDLYEGLAQYQPNPGNQRTTVSRLITRGPSCLFVQVARDYSSVGSTLDQRLATQWVGLRFDPRPTPLNPTSWVLVSEGFQPDFSQPKNPCALG